MWKAPFRPREESISQSYNDGLVDIYAVTSDKAQPGYQPRPDLTLKGTLAFEEQRVGIQRRYSAQQNQVQIERVLRVPRGFLITSQDVAIVRGNDRQYRIDFLQSTQGVYPPSWDLTLAKVEQKFEIRGGESDGQVV